MPLHIILWHASDINVYVYCQMEWHAMTTTRGLDRFIRQKAFVHA